MSKRKKSLSGFANSPWQSLLKLHNPHLWGSWRPLDFYTEYSKVIPITITFINAGLFWFPAIFFFVRAALATQRSSQARDTFGAATASHSHHSNARLSRICNLHHSSRQHWILNPLSQARSQTHVLMDTSRIHYH